MADMSPKTRVNFHLEPEQLAALRRIQARTAAPVAAQIRLAVDQWIQTQGEGEKKTAHRRANTRRKA